MIFDQYDRQQMAEAVLDIGISVARHELREARRSGTIDKQIDAIRHYGRLRTIRALIEDPVHDDDEPDTFDELDDDEREHVI